MQLFTGKFLKFFRELKTIHNHRNSLLIKMHTYKNRLHRYGAA